MRSVVVVEGLESVGHLDDFVEARGEIEAGVELVSPCAVAALDGAVESGRSGRQDIERQVAFGAGLFELGHELRAAVDLDGFDGVGHLVEDLIEEGGGVAGGGLFAGSGDGPFGAWVIGVELFDGHAGPRMDREGVDLDDVAGLFEGDVAGLADGVGTLFSRAPGGALADQGGDGLNPAAADEVADDAPDSGVGCGPALAAQDRAELLLAPHGMIETQPLDGGGESVRTLWLAHAARSSAQGLGARSPAIERGARDADRLGGLFAGQPLRHGLSPAR